MPTFKLGGDRLGSGAGMNIDTKHFNRSTHDLSFRLKTSASAGTLIPFISKILLPGSNHKIKLGCDMMTGPTVGKLFGSFKVQLDLFTAPIRLYQAQLHNDKLGIGKKMETVRFPLLRIRVPNPKPEDGTELDNFQFNPSHLLSYFDYRGMGSVEFNNVVWVERDVNGLPVLALGDIYKNYYANKQEGYGAFIHQELINKDVIVANATFRYIINTEEQEASLIIGEYNATNPVGSIRFVVQQATQLAMFIQNWDITRDFDVERLSLIIATGNFATDAQEYRITELFESYEEVADEDGTLQITFVRPRDLFYQLQISPVRTFGYIFNKTNLESLSPRITTFPLTDIDDRREDILSRVKDQTHYIINDPNYAINATPNWYTMPYSYTLDTDNTIYQTSTRGTQEGLFVKTYQNDILQTWLNKEVSQIDNITAVRVHEDEEGNGSIILNELNLNTKLYNFLNDINATSGSYRDYIKVAYNTEMARITMSPVYVGGLSKELVFEQIISNSQSGDQPLGTIGGRGVLTNKQKGGRVTLNVDEPSYLIGLFSLTPRLDYSQGNTAQMDMVNMTHLHNPYYDQIGFQDLPLEWMYWIGTQKGDNTAGSATIKQTIGKQPAWTHWQTDVNKVRGLFASKDDKMFMVLNRRWEAKWTVDASDPLNILNKLTIKDPTTYIDPVKYNFIFADTEITAENFEVQIDVEHIARMVMSGQIMPRI